MHRALCADLRAAGVQLTGEHREFGPHLTVFKITRPMALCKVSSLAPASLAAAVVWW